MGRLLLGCFAASVIAAASWAQPESRTVLGESTPLLAAGAEAIRAGRYDDGIRLTSLGLETEQAPPSVRAGALANLCGAHAAKGDPDAAIGSCDQSLALDDRNWRAYNNRSFAYWLKGMYAEAARDVDAAAALAPDAREVGQIRHLINEKTLLPQVTMQDHP